jgi:hypothetical protein
MARVVDVDDDPILQADVDSIRVDLLDMTDPSDPTPVDSTGTEITDGSAYSEPDEADVVFDTYQTDSRWTKDSTGYNFAYAMAVPTRDVSYEVRITITLTSGNTQVAVWTINAK